MRRAAKMSDDLKLLRLKTTPPQLGAHGGLTRYGLCTAKGIV